MVSGNLKVAFALAERFKQNCFSECDMKRLSAFAAVRDKTVPELDAMQMRELFCGAEAVVTSWGTPAVTTELLREAKYLRLICHCAGSVKGMIDGRVWADIRRRNILISTTSTALGIGVAEFTLGMIIAGLKKTFFMRDEIRKGQWRELQGRWFDQPENALVPAEPYDITIGVIGAGCCGSHLIKLLRNFEVKILVYDPYKTAEDCCGIGAEKSELERLVESSDVITVHAPNIPKTKGLISRELLRKVKNGALFINTAPGIEIDEEALIEELKTGRFYACLDQTIVQPAPHNHPLRNMKNVMLTPHIAGHVSNGFKRQGKCVVDELERFARGEKLKYILNLERLSIIE